MSTFLFLLVFGKLFFDYMMTIWATTQTSPTMRIPMGLVYLPVFIGVVLCALHEVYLFMEWMVRGREGGEPRPPHNDLKEVKLCLPLPHFSSF